MQGTGRPWSMRVTPAAGPGHSAPEHVGGLAPGKSRPSVDMKAWEGCHSYHSLLQTRLLTGTGCSIDIPTNGTFLLPPLPAASVPSPALPKGASFLKAVWRGGGGGSFSHFHRSLQRTTQPSPQ